jgi:probable rRNA maturation factor
MRPNENKTRQIASFVLKYMKARNLSVSISYVGRTKIRQLNKQFRGKDKSTDVLSFRQDQSYVNPKALCDIVISIPDAQKNAKNIGQNLDAEVCFLITHGILHVLGYDHERKSEERKMFALQRKIIQALKSSGLHPKSKQLIR